MLATILSIALMALTPGGTMPSSAPVVLGGGGPDAFGYSYLDSDTACAGAPTYNWVSIKGVGTEITTLGDDNYAGPFPIGFDFPYYWYRVNSVIVGANGYITFGDRSANSQEFYPVPSINPPNNQIAALLTDLDPSVGGSVWYWSNNTDSFIVEYDSVAFWDSTGGHGNNTFQIMLTRADSSITFQYKEQSGVPYQGWSAVHSQVGIENISGAVGLNYFAGDTLSANMIKDSLAVRFFPPESTSYQVHDVGVLNAMNDRNGGVFAVKDLLLSFWAAVKNYGNQPEAGYMTYFKVTRQNGSVLYADSMWAAASNPGDVESLAIASTWRPTTNGVYIIKICTKMTGDMLAVNDTAKVELRVLEIPGRLTFDGGMANDGVAWTSGGGLGSRFVPPVYPCSISAIRQYVTFRASDTADVMLAIYDDDGPDGGPGTVLFGDTVRVSSAAWYEVTLPTPVVIESPHAFFVGGIAERDSVTLGTDMTLPVSFQGWEYIGAWSPFRYATTRDVCANATIAGPVGISEWLQPTPAPVPTRIDINPNPLGGATTIRLLNPTGRETAIELYDATGSVVRTLGLSRGQATLDGRHLADGIYFARVAGTEATTVAKVIVTH